jgi:hypothetical protein
MASRRHAGRTGTACPGGTRAGIPASIRPWWPGLLFAALVIGAALLARFGPAIPVDVPYFIT